MAEIVEKPSVDIETPPGYVGNLSDSQHEALVRMWNAYFDICDRARGNASRGEGLVEDTTGTDLKKSGIPKDDKAKDEMKKLQEQQGMTALMETYGPEALRDSWWSFVGGDSPDNNMLRFVRARKGDVDRGMAMMANCLKWRLDTDVATLVANGDLINGRELEKYIDQQKSGKIATLGSTSSEQPICYVLMKYHSLWGQPAKTMQNFIVTQMETIRLYMPPPQDKATIFFDLKGFGLKQMDVVNLLFLVKVLEGYYPETLGRMYVSNAPWIFWGWWNLVKNLLDPVVKDKIVFIKGPADTDGDVPDDQLIEYCGGKVKTQFKYLDPKEDENDAQKDTATKERLFKRHRALTDKFEQVTREWCKTGGKDNVLQEQRAVLCKKLRLSEFDLDPFVRGKTVNHRNGTIVEENPGVAVFDYEFADQPTQRQIIGRKQCQKSLQQQLYDIVSNGVTCKEAEKHTADALKNGTWGEWRVNENSEEIKELASKSLGDLELGLKRGNRGES